MRSGLYEKTINDRYYEFVSNPKHYLLFFSAFDTECGKLACYENHLYKTHFYFTQHDMRTSFGITVAL